MELKYNCFVPTYLYMSNFPLLSGNFEHFSLSKRHSQMAVLKFHIILAFGTASFSLIGFVVIRSTILLAHLSRRLKGELIVCPWSVFRRSFVVLHNFKHEYMYLFNQWANHNDILSEASLGWGKGCIRFLARLDQNSGFHGNR